MVSLMNQPRLAPALVLAALWLAGCGVSHRMLPCAATAISTPTPATLMCVDRPVTFSVDQTAHPRLTLAEKNGRDPQGLCAEMLTWKERTLPGCDYGNLPRGACGLPTFIEGEPSRSQATAESFNLVVLVQLDNVTTAPGAPPPEPAGPSPEAIGQPPWTVERPVSPDGSRYRYSGQALVVDPWAPQVYGALSFMALSSRELLQAIDKAVVTSLRVGLCQ